MKTTHRAMKFLATAAVNDAAGFERAEQIWIFRRNYKLANIPPCISRISVGEKEGYMESINRHAWILDLFSFYRQ